MARHAARAGDELPPLPDWCEGTCVVDIAFAYAPEVIGCEHWEDSDHAARLCPQSAAELRRRIDESIRLNNVAWRRAGLDAELRLVGVKREPRARGVRVGRSGNSLDSWGHAPWGAARLRHLYGADLASLITGEEHPSFCGLAAAREAGYPLELAYRIGFSAIWIDCLGNNYVNYVLAHEVGHNLGLDHDRENATGITPVVPFGRGYRYRTAAGRLDGTIMELSGGNLSRFSSSSRLHGRMIGNADADAARALRYTIPDATRYSPTVVPEAQEDPEDYGCERAWSPPA